MRRGARYDGTQRQWREWAVDRRREADRIQRLYRRQAAQVEELMLSISCPCDPIIMFRSGTDGPILENPIVNHALDCKRS